MSIRVLLVDDDSDIRLLLRMWIEGAPEDLVIVGEAAGAEQALEQLDEADPDVVLLDARMPAIDGFETAELILARRPWQKLVLYTGALDDKLRRQAIEAGFVACVSKDDFARLPGVIAAAGRPTARL
jgi:CheY-like chemotaxis protein